LVAISGMSATRVSLAAVSFSTPTTTGMSHIPLETLNYSIGLVYL
jgi:hypothetical protein